MDSDSDSDDETANKRPAKRKADGSKGSIDNKEKKSKSQKGESYSMKYPGVFVTETNDRDVLQGRGSGSNLYQGNMVYRDMIEEIASSYTSTTSRKEKNRLVDELISVIHGMNGRFLHPVESDEAAKLGLDSNKDFFFEITDADAVDKVKQAIRYVHYKKRPLMEQRMKEAAERGEPSPIPGIKDKKVPTPNVSSSNNTDRSIQQLLQSVSSSIPSEQSGPFPSAKDATTVPFLQLQQKLLLQQHVPGSISSSHNIAATSRMSSQSASLLEESPHLQLQETSKASNLNMDAKMLLQVQQQKQSAAPPNPLLDVLSGFQQQGQDARGNWHSVLQQQLLLKQLQQLQQEQAKQRQQQQHHMLQTLLQMQPGQPINQQFLLSALADSSGQRQESISSSQPFSLSTHVLSSLLQKPAGTDISYPLNSPIQQLLAQQQSQQNDEIGASAHPLPDQINQLLIQQQRLSPALHSHTASSTTRRPRADHQSRGSKPAAAPPLNKLDFSLQDNDSTKPSDKGQGGKSGHPKKFKRLR